MAQVIAVQSTKKDPLQTILPIGGAIVGGIYGGGAGAMAGAGAGQMAGGILAKPAMQNQVADAGSGESSAMARRSAQLAAENGDPTNYNKLVAAETAASDLPEKMRQEYMAALTQARMLEEQRLMKAAQQQPQTEYGVA